MTNHYSKLTSECGSASKRCKAALWSPSTSPHFVEDRAFSCYAIDKERAAAIEKMITLLVNAGEELAYSFAFQCKVYDSLGIDSDGFTDEEVDYIETELARRFDDK